MAFIVQENTNLALYSTFRMGGTVRYFVELTDEKDIPEIIRFAKEKQVPVVILGGGSNTLFMSEKLNALILKINVRGYVWQEENDAVLVTVGAGEIWDDFVEQSVLRGLSGIEALSLIPGTVGGTPVQNVGAYGQEVKNTIVSVRAYDIETAEIVIFTNDMCAFSYRDSVFKHFPNRYIITAVMFKLSKEMPQIPNYPGVAKYFEEHEIQNPTLKDIRKAICTIRQTKLPDLLGFPPASFIWSHTVCTEYLCSDWPSMCERPLILCDEAKNLVARWKECKLAILRSPSQAPALSRAIRADIEKSAEHIHVQSAKLLDALNERARQGEYLW